MASPVESAQRAATHAGAAPPAAETPVVPVVSAATPLAPMADALGANPSANLKGKTQIGEPLDMSPGFGSAGFAQASPPAYGPPPGATGGASRSSATSLWSRS